MKIYTWENSFHNSLARSTLTPEDINNIEYSIYVCDPDKNGVRKLKRLENKLCGMSDCHCSVFNKVIEQFEKEKENGIIKNVL